MIKNKIIGLVAFAMVFTCFYSCKKKDSIFGKDIYDPELLLDAGGIDTFSLIAYSEYIDSTFTRNARYGLLGAYNDPVFGKVSASVFTQLRLNANNPDFGNLSDITVDSVVLALEYRDQYGVGNIPQNFAVFRLTQALNKDSNYLTSSITSTEDEQLIESGQTLITPNVYARPVINGDTLLPQLRLRLKASLGTEILNSSLAGHMADNDAFLAWFRGLHVVTQDANFAVNSGAVYSFDLTSNASKLIIYYTKTNQTGTENKTYDLIINSNNVYYNQVLYTPGFPVESLIQNPILGKNEFYAQTGKVRAVVRFPGVMSLSNKTVIHRATLYLPYSYFNGDDRYPSPALFATNRRGDEDGIWGLALQSGVLVPIVHSLVPQFKRYTIDVTSFVQGLIKLNPNYTIPEILITGSRTNDNVERIIFNGVESTNKYRPKLIITYTEF